MKAQMRKGTFQGGATNIHGPTSRKKAPRPECPAKMVLGSTPIMVLKLLHNTDNVCKATAIFHVHNMPWQVLAVTPLALRGALACQAFNNQPWQEDLYLFTVRGESTWPAHGPALPKVVSPMTSLGQFPTPSATGTLASYAQATC